MADRRREIEWPTLILLAAVYLGWILATTVLPQVWMPLAFAVLTLSIVLHASLQHEVLHGHPFRTRWLNEGLVFLPLGLAYPYGRFRDTHLAHHRDERLTDPYDDPESNFLDPSVWENLPSWRQKLLRINNTLAGRMLVGPLLGVVSFAANDLRAARAGDRAIVRDWALHAAGLCLVALWIGNSGFSWTIYLLAAYAAMSVLKIRTFLEHRAHQLARGRTVIVEKGWILPFLFLNNNLHIVHHSKPNVAWYRLPQLFREGRDAYLKRNDGYYYASYGDIFRRHFLRAKDPVPHPLMRHK
ncbi:fatty acid desaturase [Defluviimonas sp. WL0002]|uniref:Fatty acid desaturase n=1 Tax=Albidovulum marisflavi TaxID=2984159 RepID=A0ABT2ZCD5_9RHOB|nr:fatty acid desaturase [Defluviimonas sp. WL0002]MCV2868799.1 fatty acid desaturase [Defluviimonas sp. WL0002]